MKTTIKKILLVSFLLVADSAEALEPEVLYGFEVGPDHLGPRSPYASLVQGIDGHLYGTSSEGGSNYNGTVFKVTTNGVLTTLASFGPTTYDNGTFTNANGAKPGTAITFGSDGNLYGTTWSGGSGGHGTIFRVTTNGVLTSLAAFQGTNGSYPNAPLLSAGSEFYGTTLSGGIHGHGTLFKITRDGVLTTLISFAGVDGAFPGELVSGGDGAFYGTTARGGTGFTGYGTGLGTIFKVTPGGVLTTLVFLDGDKGARPGTALVMGGDGNFYGTTVDGGTSDQGTFFRMTRGGVLTTVVSFDARNPAFLAVKLLLGRDGDFYGAASDAGGNAWTVVKLTTNGVWTLLFPFDSANGVYPNALMQANDGSFYGTTQRGGSAFGTGIEGGTVFQVTTNGDLTTFVAFASFYSPDPGAGLTQGIDGHFYGTTGYGGPDGYGTVFKVTASGALTTLASFNGVNGAGPQAKLLFGHDGAFYGTTASGGSGFTGFGTGFGTIFRVTSIGELSTLALFDGQNSAYPRAALTLDRDGDLYGTTTGGGLDGGGTIFKVTTNGVLTTLLYLDGASGQRVTSGLVLGENGDFYGTTSQDRESGSYGTIFKVTSNGVLTTLASVEGAVRSQVTLGADGALYGTTYAAGRNKEGVGTVFKATTDGLVTTLFAFTGSNGAYPQAALVLAKDGNFYGTTSTGGGVNGGGSGTIFRLTTNGALTTLASFDGEKGAFPNELLLGHDGNLYGTTSTAGTNGGGTIFRLPLSPKFTTVKSQAWGRILLAGTGLPNEMYQLWGSTDLSSPLASWTLLQSASLDANGNFSYTDAPAKTPSSHFYQLSTP